MTPEQLQAFLDQYPTLGPWAVGAGAVSLSIIVFLIARFLVARVLVYVAGRTANKYDDILAEKLRPYRFAWLAPLLVIYFLANLLPGAADTIQRVVLFLILWLVVITLNSLFNALNAMYEAIQAEIVDHLLASLPGFDLRVFQEPTGMDFRAAYGGQPSLSGGSL